MRRLLTRTAVLGMLVLSACTDGRQDSTLPSEPGVSGGPQAVPAPCPSLTTLKNLAKTVFASGIPNANSVIGKLDNLDQDIKKGKLDQAKQKAIDIVSFILKKKGSFQPQSTLLGFINGVLCYAGFPGDLSSTPDLGGIIVTTASDNQPTEAIRDDQQAGFVAPAGAFNAPPGTLILITISQVPKLLNTLLDQYPGVFNFQSSAELDDTLVVGVCLTVDVSDPVLARLRLGHDQDAGAFEITPFAPPPAGLNCDPTPGPAPPPSFGIMRKISPWLAAVGRWFLPQPATAAVRAGGGVGGSAGKLSPFGPVDPKLSATGGAGGSAGKLAPPALTSILGGGPRPAEVGCSFPVGTQVSEACRPQVTIMTAQYKKWFDDGAVPPQQGNLIPDVDVTFEVGTGGGAVTGATVAAFDGASCGTFGNPAVRATDSAGVASACWKLSTTPGLNKVWVTPEPGQLPPDVYFDPTDLTFYATGTPTDGAFESDPGWTTIGFWHRTTLKDVFNTPFRNSAVTDGLVNLAPGDASSGDLPAPFNGSHAFWHGEDPPKGNYIGTRANSIVGFGGTSVDTVFGRLHSPEFIVPPGAVLNFDTWWEIESVNPSSFDIMEVFLWDGATAHSLGALNPTSDPGGGAPTPFTSGGFNAPPVWVHKSVSIAAYAGAAAQIWFQFRSIDERYNGFRGWLVDNVEVVGSAIRGAAIQTATALGGGLNPKPPSRPRNP